LNLRDLTVTSLSLQSGVGDVDLALPAVGQGDMWLRLGLGDLTLRVPEGMAVKLKLTPGPLTQVRLDGDRFIQTSASEWVTPNFSASAQRFTLSISLTAGDLQVVRLL
jgi:predicted membrane protein